MKNLLVAAALLGALTFPAQAEDALGFVTPDDPVTGHADKSYADLLVQVIPDLHADGDGWTGTLSDIRHVSEDEPGETPDPVNIQYVEVRVLDGAGVPNIWVMADIGDGGMLGTYTLLSVFDGKTLKLIDAAEVDSDRLTGFIDEPLRISPKDQAVLVDTEHSNSDQTYQLETLLFLRDGKLTAVDDFFPFGTRDCVDTQFETLHVTAQPTDAPYWPITAVITKQTAHVPESEEYGCTEPTWKDFRFQDFTAVYVWEAAEGRYVTTSKELDELNDADAELH